VDSHRNLRINIGQLRIKRQIDSQRCDSSVADVMQSEINKQLKNKGFRCFVMSGITGCAIACMQFSNYKGSH
jgi:hypothetical protein